MKVIRDKECFGLLMIPLIQDLGVSPTCQIKKCGNVTSVILCFAEGERVHPDLPPLTKPGHLGICEFHYQEAKMKGGHFYFTVENRYKGMSERK